MNERLLSLAWDEAFHRHKACSDAAGLGVMDGHKDTFLNCPQSDCVLVRDARAYLNVQPVLLRWVMELPLAMQGTLVMAMRGPDNAPKDGLAKDLTRAYRAACLINAHEKGTPGDDFMGDYSGLPPNPDATLAAFRRDHDQYPHHWLMHLIHGAQIIGAFHDDDTVVAFWDRFYHEMCSSFHMHGETLVQMQRRLRSLKKTEVKEP